jgi:hypothetical protein
MPTQTSPSSKASKSKQQSPATASVGAAQESATGLNTPDTTYGLVSVLYHALQGADTYQKYIQDAQRGGDEELVEFFQDCLEGEQERASRAKSLLASRLEEDADEDDEDDEDEDDEDDEDDE